MGTRRNMVPFAFVLALSLSILVGCAPAGGTPGTISAPAQVDESQEAAVSEEATAQSSADGADDAEPQDVEAEGKTALDPEDEVRARIKEQGKKNTVLSKKDVPLSADDPDAPYDAVASILSKAVDGLRAEYQSGGAETKSPSYEASVRKWLSEYTDAARVFANIVIRSGKVSFERDSLIVLSSEELDDGVFKISFTLRSDGSDVAWFDGYYVRYFEGYEALKLSDCKVDGSFSF